MKIYCNRNNLSDNSFAKYTGKDIWILCEISEEIDDLVFAFTWVNVKSRKYFNVNFTALSIADDLDEAEVNYRLSLDYEGYLVGHDCIRRGNYYYRIHQPVNIATTQELLELAKDNGGRPPFMDDI